MPNKYSQEILDIIHARAQIGITDVAIANELELNVTTVGMLTTQYWNDKMRLKK